MLLLAIVFIELFTTTSSTIKGVGGRMGIGGGRMIGEKELMGVGLGSERSSGSKERSCWVGRCK